MKNKFKYLLERWKNRNSWWVCEYEITCGGMSQSGRFAEFGADKEEALKNAFEWIKRDSLVSGEVKYFVRRPNILEIFNV
jgi:hypothetical protein